MRIDALVDLGEKEGGVLYSGILEDYKLSKNGGLELIYLTNAYRRFVRDDEVSNAKQAEKMSLKSFFHRKKPVDPYYYMPEHYFVLKYKEIKNLNIYYDFEERDPLFDNEEWLGLTFIAVILVLAIWISGNVIIGIVITIIITYLISRYGDNSDDMDASEDENE